MASQGVSYTRETPKKEGAAVLPVGVVDPMLMSSRNPILVSQDGDASPNPGNEGNEGNEVEN